MKYISLLLGFSLVLVGIAHHASVAPLGATQPAITQGLRFTLDNNGLSGLSYQGQSLLGAVEQGSFVPTNNTPQFRRADSSTYIGRDKPTSSMVDVKTGKVTRLYEWGSIACTYTSQGDQLRIGIRVENQTADTLNLTLRVAELTFPQVPQGLTLDAGQFGTGGKLHPLSDYPLHADPHWMPPLVLANYGTGALAFCGEDVKTTTVSVPFASDGTTKLRYPLWVTPAPLKAHTVETFNVSLRFGAAGSSATAIASELLKRYVAAYPQTVTWRDRRPIGALFLATSEKEAHPANNPRGWFNDRNVDVISEAGRAQWRARLMKYADDSIKVLRGMNAQGMVTWDPSGQEFGSATYYGDPTLTDSLAPETLLKGAGKLGAIDECFQKFRDAGLRVGVCIRPQQIRMAEGVPVQEDATDIVRTLETKIAYAKKRWGCTLFYVDSTVVHEMSCDPDIFERVAKAFPDVLLMPENEAPRYFAYSAPFNSFFHHKVTSTPEVMRELYPHAFSAIYAPEGEFAKYHDELVAAVRRGDILLFQGWWDNPGNAEVKKIYAEAKQVRP